MTLRIADDRRAAAICRDDRAFRHRLFGVVGPFAVHVRLQESQQPLDVRIAEHHDVIHAAKSGDELGTIRRGQDGTARTLERRDGRIVVDRDDQTLGFRRGAFQIAYVADVQQIEAAVRERDRPAGRAIARDDGAKICFG